MAKRMFGVGLLLGFFCLLWLGKATPVYAESTAVYSDTIALQKTDWAHTMTFPKFDPSLGLLTGIEFSLLGRLQGAASVESLDAKPVTVTVGMAATAQLQRPDGSQLLLAKPFVTTNRAMAAFDGTIDYAGPSGAVIDPLIGLDAAESNLLTTPSDLTFFMGPGTIDLPVRTSGAAQGQGSGNLALSYTTLAEAQTTVTYHYTVPAITLKKYTNGEDADDAPGPMINPGNPVTWTYVITNTGATALVEIVLLDDKEGAIACPRTSLAAGEAMLCTHTGMAATGQYTNVATVTGKTPEDGVNARRIVQDEDPSHYFGPEIAACPVDLFGEVQLPKVQYLGQGSGVYTLPAGFETFIIKRYIATLQPPFVFRTEPGVVENGQTVYRSPANAPRRERVWACAGACDFVPHLDGEVRLGHLVPGLTIGAVVIDDDDDQRLNSWIVDGDINNPYQTITDQQMVQYLTLDIPFAGDWGYYARDSIGMVTICVSSSDAGLLLPAGTGNGREAPLPEEAEAPLPTVNSTLYLPAIVARR